MKLIESDGKQFVFHIDKREKRLLVDLVSLYPLIPPAHHRISRSVGNRKTDQQQLLEEALAEHRRESKKQVETLLNEPNRFQQVRSGFRFTVTAEQIESLLQVLNDVRVGSWLILGEPDEKKGKNLDLTEQNARYLWAMELAGFFESIFLYALNGGSKLSEP